MPKSAKASKPPKTTKTSTHKAYRAPDAGALLVNRAQVARLLSCSRSTIIRLEEAGRLRPVKLIRARNGVTFYRAAEVRALASGGDA